MTTDTMDSSMAIKRSEDFRDWDIEVETSYSGFDQLGFPYYIWRERSDSRLSLGRPRYCCVTERNNELYFTFFNPSENICSNGTTTAFVIAAGLVTIAMLALGWIDGQKPRVAYVYDTHAPPFLIFVATFMYAMFAGLISSSVWYVAVTLYRWINGRFKDDGRVIVVPLNMLEGFQVISAGDAARKSTASAQPLGTDLQHPSPMVRRLFWLIAEKGGSRRGVAAVQHIVQKWFFWFLPV